MRTARAVARLAAALRSDAGRRGVGHTTTPAAPRAGHPPPADPPPPPRRSAFDGLPPPGSDADAAAAAGAAAAEAAPPALPAPLRFAARALFGSAALAAAGAAALTATTTQQEAEALAKQYSPGAVGAALAWYCEKRAAAAAAVDAYAAPPTDRLLPDLPPHARHVRTLVLDLDDLLIHSHWTRGRGWRTFKRPGVDDFLRGAAQYYEVVVYTAQLPTYADPILDRLDPSRYIQYRLYRDSTRYEGGVHARDVASLNRDPARVLLVTSDPATAAASPSNAVLVHGWDGGDAADTGLLDLLPFLEAVFRSDVADVRAVVDAYRGKDVGVAFKERMRAADARKAAGAGGAGGGEGVAKGRRGLFGRGG